MRSRIVIYNPLLDSVLLIHRRKAHRDYWVIPGGGKKGQETAIQTAIREVNEELQIKIKAADLTYIFEVEDGEKQCIFFAKSKVMTTPQISGEELKRSNKENVYIPTWVNLAVLTEINLQPVMVATKLINYFNHMDYDA